MVNKHFLLVSMLKIVVLLIYIYIFFLNRSLFNIINVFTVTLMIYSEDASLLNKIIILKKRKEMKKSRAPAPLRFDAKVPLWSARLLVRLISCDVATLLNIKWFSVLACLCELILAKLLGFPHQFPKCKCHFIALFRIERWKF